MKRTSAHTLGIQRKSQNEYVFVGKRKKKKKKKARSGHVRVAFQMPPQVIQTGVSLWTDVALVRPDP